MAILRNLCLKMNIQVAAKEYDFSAESPFTTEDVLDIFPVVKHCLPKVRIFIEISYRKLDEN